VTPWTMDPGIDLRSDRLPAADAERQQRTAAEVLARLNRQPGVIVADEVGMGKTFVAMAVAASVVRSTGSKRPVVVMVPPSVANKWPTDWQVFAEHCLPAGSGIRATASPVSGGAEFLKLLDDPPSRRQHVIFMKHGALRRSMRDPFIQLAVIHHAFRYQRNPELLRRRDVLPRWASRLLGNPRFNEQRTAALLGAPVSAWSELSSDWSKHDDDPVPEALVNALPDLDLSGVRDALLLLPVKSSGGVYARIDRARREFRTSLDEVWKAAISAANLRLPLLILDEAHHVKNPNQLASLFSDDADVDGGFDGALFETFERMLFLTATPFQLGHRELLRVLQRFGAVRLTRPERAEFTAQLDELGESLDASQLAISHLDRAWERLRPTDVAGLRPDWWSRPVTELPDQVRVAAAAAQRATSSFDRAQAALQPWVIRHRRVHRRDVIGGDGILPGRRAAGPKVVGIEVDAAASVPFLLAARAEALVRELNLRTSTSSRAIFSEGLASSYETFRRRDWRDGGATTEPTSAEFEWYLQRIDEFIPRDDLGVLEAHPKIAATTARVVDLWSSGEKVLVFVFYRATGNALQQSISRALRAEIERRAGGSGLSIEELHRRARNQLDADSPAARLAVERTVDLGRACGLEPSDAEQLAEVVLRFLRTPSYQARFLLSTGGSGDDSLAEAIGAALDPSGPNPSDLARSLDEFARRAAKMVDVEREQLWNALLKVQTGDRGRSGEEESLSAMVRLANGDTDADVRLRLATTFNSPFFPEVLIVSSVMAEGVDLQRECRHVIHHDLDWNPSVLEQRTGRVDRVGSRAERLGERIGVYEPFLAGTQDERLYRVVKDRERWFNVVMGGMSSLSQDDVDRIAERVPLPTDLEQRLTLDLEV
jgi:hypothetical protein